MPLSNPSDLCCCIYKVQVVMPITFKERAEGQHFVNYKGQSRGGAAVLTSWAWDSYRRGPHRQVGHTGPWGSLRIVASISFSRMGKWWWGSASCRGRSGCCCCLLEFPGRGPVESARVKQSCRYCDLTEQVWGMGGCLVSSSALKLLLGGTHSDKLLSWGN